MLGLLNTNQNNQIVQNMNLDTIQNFFASCQSQRIKREVRITNTEKKDTKMSN